MSLREEILRLTNNGYNIFSYYLPNVDINKKKTFKSPFYDDKKPSCSIFKGRDGTWLFKDHGDGGFYSGDAFWFVATMFNYHPQKDFPKVLEQIAKDLRLPVTTSKNTSILEKNDTTPVKLSPPPLEPMTHKAPPYQATPKDFSEKEMRYWGKYGISPEVLKEFQVLSLLKYASLNSKGKPYEIYSSDAEPIYFYQFESACKIYRPHSPKMRFLQGGTKSPDFIFGLKQLPPKGFLLFITGGEKDVMSLYAHGFPAICFNSETSSIPEKAIESLSRRFRNIIILFDNDSTGKTASARESSRLSHHNVLSMELPFNKEEEGKDISDFFALGHTAQELNDLIQKRIKEKNTQQMTILDSCQIKSKMTLNTPSIIVSAYDNPLGVNENLFCIAGEAGTGKSHFISAIIAGAISETPLPMETTLGMTVLPNPAKKAVLHFDTEQSDWQLYKNIEKSLIRAGLPEIPNYYQAYCLTPQSRKDRLELIKASMEMAHLEHNGIHLIVIDGLADLIFSANDERESISLIEQINTLAGVYNTCIIGVLHYAPSTLKLRGHLGSEVSRKASGILAIEKDSSNPKLSIVKALKAREGSCYDIPLILFGWDNDANMHIFKGTKSQQAQEERKFKELSSIVRNILKNKTQLDFDTFLEKVGDAQNHTAPEVVKKDVQYLIEKQIIEVLQFDKQELVQLKTT